MISKCKNCKNFLPLKKEYFCLGNLICTNCNFSSEIMCRPTLYTTWEGYVIYELAFRKEFGSFQHYNLSERTKSIMPKKLYRLIFNK